MTAYNLENHQDDEINSMNKDINVENKDTILLDSRIKYENDDMKSSSLSPSGDGTFPLSPSDSDSLTLSSSDNATPSLSPSGLTRGSRNMDFSSAGYSCQSTNMTRMISQSGRSMVEMLGVLAVIGVLSIGGIMGYSYGMDKYRANETINDINLRGIDLVRQVAMGQEPSLTEWETKSTAGYTFSNAQLSAEGDAYFTVSGVPKRVCEIIYAGIQNNQTTDIEVNEATNGDASDCNKDDDNVMGFFFITNAGEGGSVDELCKDVTCKEGYSCTHGICMSEEVPQKSSEWKMCSSNNACGICEQCVKSQYSNEFYCEPLADGTSCETGKECQLGQCAEAPIIAPTSDILGKCTNNSECESNYYCGYLYDKNIYDVLDFKTCIFAEFHKVPLPDGDYFYVSQHKNIFEDAEAMCASIGMTFIENFEDRQDIIEALKAFTTEGSGIGVLSKTQRCTVYRSRYGCYTQSSSSKDYIVCVK